VDWLSIGAFVDRIPPSFHCSSSHRSLNALLSTLLRSNSIVSKDSCVSWCSASGDDAAMLQRRLKKLWAKKNVNFLLLLFNFSKG